MNLTLTGNAGETVILGLSTASQPTTIPGVGELCLDTTRMYLAPTIVLKSVNGQVATQFSFGVPRSQLGRKLYWQAGFFDASGKLLRFSNCVPTQF